VHGVLEEPLRVDFPIVFRFPFPPIPEKFSSGIEEAAQNENQYSQEVQPIQGPMGRQYEEAETYVVEGKSKRDAHTFFPGYLALRQIDDNSSAALVRGVMNPQSSLDDISSLLGQDPERKPQEENFQNVNDELLGNAFARFSL